MFCRCSGSATPFGGPASGLWPKGSGAGAAAAPPAAAAETPAPPAPQCQAASLFSECFTGGNSGWTVVSPAGTVVFDGTKMLEGSSGADTQGEARKALPAAPAGAWTSSFKFTEVNTAPSAGKNYALGMFDSLGNSIFSMVLIGDGSGFLGDMSDIYLFTWTPSQGATHTVVLTRNGPGSLTLTIDGTPITLTPIAPGPIAGAASVVDAAITNNDLDGMGAFDEIFLTDGLVVGGLRFCCPEESP